MPLSLNEIISGMAEKVSDPALRRDLEQPRRLGLVELAGFDRGAKCRLRSRERAHNKLGKSSERAQIWYRRSRAGFG